MKAIEEIRSAAAAAANTPDPTLAAFYLAAARVGLDTLRRQVDDLETLVRAREAELVRLAGGQK